MWVSVFPASGNCRNHGEKGAGTSWGESEPLGVSVGNTADMWVGPHLPTAQKSPFSEVRAKNSEGRTVGKLDRHLPRNTSRF